MSKQQTAVEWLVEQLKIKYDINIERLSVTDKSKAMEKQQIINAFEKAVLDGWNTTSAEYYYNDTYNTNHE
jgi:hypothetical protein